MWCLCDATVLLYTLCWWDDSLFGKEIFEICNDNVNDD